MPSPFSSPRSPLEDGRATMPVVKRANIYDYYDFESYIAGSGASGARLWRGIHKAERQAYAVKEFTLDKRAEFNREIAIMKWLEHPNVVAFKEAVETPDGLHLVMELLDGGSVLDVYNNEEANRQRLTRQDLQRREKKVHTFCKVLLNILEFSKARGVLLADMKLEDFLYRSPNDRTVKIIDFGISLFQEEFHRHDRIQGTITYLAPEVAYSGKYSYAADMWSLGVIVYSMLHGNFLHDKETLDDLRVYFDTYVFPKQNLNCFSAQAQDFVMRCLELNETDRMSVEIAKRHPWITGEPSDVTKLSKALGGKLKRRTISGTDLVEAFESVAPSKLHCYDPDDVHVRHQYAHVEPNGAPPAAYRVSSPSSLPGPQPPYQTTSPQHGRSAATSPRYPEAVPAADQQYQQHEPLIPPSAAAYAVAASAGSPPHSARHSAGTPSELPVATGSPGRVQIPPATADMLFSTPGKSSHLHGSWAAPSPSQRSSLSGALPPERSSWDETAQSARASSFGGAAASPHSSRYPASPRLLDGNGHALPPEPFGHALPPEPFASSDYPLREPVKPAIPSPTATLQMEDMREFAKVGGHLSPISRRKIPNRDVGTWANLSCCTRGISCGVNSIWSSLVSQINSLLLDAPPSDAPGTPPADRHGRPITGYRHSPGPGRGSVLQVFGGLCSTDSGAASMPPNTNPRMASENRSKSTVKGPSIFSSPGG
eukprot:tig00020538_g10317.t1